MEKKYINMAFEGLEITGSDELFQKIIEIGRYNNIIEAFTDNDSHFYTVTIISPGCIFEVNYCFEDGEINCGLVSTNVLTYVFKLGIHSMNDLMSLTDRR